MDQYPVAAPIPKPTATERMWPQPTPRDRRGNPEGLRRDIRAIASTVFCGTGIDPSVVSFAKRRASLHWGLTEEEVDVLVSARLLRTSAKLMTDLDWTGIEQVPDIHPAPATVVAAA